MYQTLTTAYIKYLKLKSKCQKKKKAKIDEYQIYDDFQPQEKINADVTDIQQSKIKMKFKKKKRMIQKDSLDN